MFVIEVVTKTGTICESCATYEEAVWRVNQFPEESLLTLPLIFKELSDGSQRLVREDGKPLQWHRLPEDLPPGPVEPIPLAEATGNRIELPRQPAEDFLNEDEPISLVDDSPRSDDQAG